MVKLFYFVKKLLFRIFSQMIHNIMMSLVSRTIRPSLFYNERSLFVRGLRSRMDSKFRWGSGDGVQLRTT